MGQQKKNMPAVQETQVQSLGQGDPMEEDRATCSSLLAGKIPGTEEPGGLQSMGSEQSDTTERACLRKHVFPWEADGLLGLPQSVPISLSCFYSLIL